MVVGRKSGFFQPLPQRDWTFIYESLRMMDEADPGNAGSVRELNLDVSEMDRRELKSTLLKLSKESHGMTNYYSSPILGIRGKPLRRGVVPEDELEVVLALRKVSAGLARIANKL